MNTFETGAMVRFGWESFKKRPWFFVGVTLLVLLLYGVSAGISAAFGDKGIGAAIGSIVSFALTTFIMMGITAFFLKAHDAPETVESGMLFHPQPYIKFLAARLLVSIVVVIGFILLIV